MVNANVDNEEIAKFSAMASRWWDPESEFKPLHDINPLRFEYILNHCGPLADKSIIDVGCGGGLLTESLARTGADVTGIDLGEAALKVAKLHQYESGLNIQYEMISAEDKAAQCPEQFDLVSCLEMLEHVPEPEAIVKACFDMLKPGGTAVFSTLNRNPKSYLFAILGAEYLLRMLPRGTHDYAKFIKPAELVQSCREVGFTPMEMTGMHHNPVTGKYWLSQSNLDVNYLLLCHKSEEC